MIRFPSRAATLAVGLAMTPVLAGCGLNGSSTREEMAQARWAEVRSQYGSRVQLTSDMVGALQGVAAPQDAPALRQLGARVTAPVPAPDTPTDPAAFRRYQTAQLQLTRALDQLEQISTRYPQLRANRNFVVLQSRLDGSEGRIAVARNDYNEAAEDYNDALGRFPTSLWSGGRARMQVFTADPPAPAAPPPVPAGAPTPTAPGTT
ncbi:MAG: LemA family protein [Brevundimonas sp.]|nr:MAG: LemA family protein [Brevundimonas sp.]